MFKKHKNFKLLTFQVLPYAFYNTEEIKVGLAFVRYSRLEIHRIIFNFSVWSCKI